MTVDVDRSRRQRGSRRGALGVPVDPGSFLAVSPPLSPIRVGSPCSTHCCLIFRPEPGNAAGAALRAQTAAATAGRVIFLGRADPGVEAMVPGRPTRLSAVARKTPLSRQCRCETESALAGLMYVAGVVETFVMLAEQIGAVVNAVRSADQGVDMVSGRNVVFEPQDDGRTRSSQRDCGSGNRTANCHQCCRTTKTMSRRGENKPP